jgi:hypothetical protein
VRWSCGALRSNVGQGPADAGKAEADHGTPGAAHGRDGVPDLGSFVVGQVVKVRLDSADKAPRSADFRVAGQRFGFDPLVDVDGGQQPFPVAEEVDQVGLQLGQVGDVGAEMGFRVKSGRVASILCSMRSG